MEGNGGGGVRQRAVMATDAEWDLIRARARAAGVGVSRYVVRRLTEPAEAEAPLPGGLPEEVWRRVAREVMVLSRVEGLRLAGQGASETYEALGREADAWLEAEERTG